MKTERTFSLPALLHKDGVSDELVREFTAFVGVEPKARYIFLSRTESVVIESPELFKGQLPPDVNLIYLKIEGGSGFVEMKNRSSFKNFNEVKDRTLNQLIVQGGNPVAVRGLLLKAESLLRPQQFLLRTIFYRFPLTWFWATLILVWFAEYRVARFIHPSLSLYAPLSAFGAVVIFAIALGTTLIYANFALPFFSYWFPYFEIEGNISTYRLSFQKFVGVVWGALVTAGVLNLLNLLYR